MSWLDYLTGSTPRNRRKTSRRMNVLLVRARSTEVRAARRKTTTVVALCLAVLLLAIAVATMAVRELGRTLFTECELFTLRNLDLASDGILTPKYLRENAGLEQATNLFGVDLQEVERKLLNVPRIRSATVTRILPDTLRVRVIERVPLAVIAANSHWLIDRHGYVLGPAFPSTRLPVLRHTNDTHLRPGRHALDAQTIQALDLLDLCDRTPLGKLLGIAEVSGLNSDHIEIRLLEGARVLMGRTNLENRLTQLAQIIKENREMGREPQYYDARGEGVIAAGY